MMEQALTQLDAKILFDDFTYHANIYLRNKETQQTKI